jgi:predicted ATP-dependent endonuclease of OLD family
MQITNLDIKQYKSLKNLNLDNLFDVNIFIGPNNSGKSNVLDAIESLFLPSDKSEFFIDKESDYHIEIKLDEEAKKFFKTTAQTLTAKRSGEKKTYFLGSKKFSNLKQIEIFFNKRAVRFNSMLVENIQKIREDYADLKSNYKNEFKNLWQIFNQYFPDIDEIISSEVAAKTTQEITAKLKQGGKIVQFSRLGTGVRRIFVMMLYIFHPRYSIILMNEPEIHLHPALIKKIANLMEAHVKNEQIFFTTHSPIFITPEKLQQVFRVNKDKSQNTEFYFFTKRDNINKNRLVQEFNADNLEMFFADKVVITEGISDKILLRGLINKFYNGRKEIKVISVSGKYNIDIYIKLMRIFKIPYLVLLDRDVLYGFGVKTIRQYVSLSNVRQPKLSYNSRRQKRNKIRKRRQRVSGLMLKQIEELKKDNIYILPNGTIENNYPRKYQRRDTKPLNALYAVSQITEEEFYSRAMANLREIVEVL